MENRDRNDNNATQTGQQDQQQQDQQSRQQQNPQSEQGQQPPAGQDRSSGAKLAEGQGDTTAKPDVDGQTKADEQGGGGSSGFVGSSQGDSSESYVTKDPTAKSDFAEQGQGALEDQDTSAGNSDITTGQPRKEDANLDDGSTGA